MAKSFVADVSDLGQVSEVVAQVEETMGPIDTLMNNAGINSGIGPIWEVDPELWWQDMRRFDALVGRVFRPNDDFDELEARIGEIVEKDLLTLRLKT